MISIVVNLDTRPQSEEFGGLGSGVVHYDLLLEGLINKRKFFDEFQTELIGYVDEHTTMSPDLVEEMRKLCDCLVIRKHTKAFAAFNPFSDFNSVSMLNAISLARGSHICHMDMDTVVFGKPSAVFDLMELANQHKFVCYPSQWSPKPIDDPSFGNHVWASTRFLFCRRENIDLTELYGAIQDPYQFYDRRGYPPRINNWLEHYLGVWASADCYYPPFNYESWLVFCWTAYKAGVLRRLNGLSYEEVVPLIKAAGGMNYDGIDGRRIPE